MCLLAPRYILPCCSSSCQIRGISAWPYQPLALQKGCSMNLTTPSASAAPPGSSRLANSRWGSALGRAWHKLTLVHADDPVRYVLNRGFAYVLTVLILSLLLLALVAIPSNAPLGLKVVILLAFPLLGVIWWLNRQGTVYGAMLYVFMVATFSAFGSTPSSYASDPPVVHVI